MMQPIIRFFFLCNVVMAIAVAFPENSQSQTASTIPSVPGRILESIPKINHPFLLATQDQFFQTQRLIRQDLLTDRRDEFHQRIVGYFNPDSKWYLGDGPLGENNDFHPMQLIDEDYYFYEQVICEVLAYWGIEKERWASEGLIREFQRILEEIQPSSEGETVSSISSQIITDRQVQMFSLACLIYDMIYSRFSTIERHPVNNRLNQFRQKLAAECAAADPDSLPIPSRIVRGTALGLSTLLCIWVYPNEWAKEGRFSQQSFLPDLYRAITYTNSGTQKVVSLSPQLDIPIPQLGSLLITAIPWMESLQRVGYPYRIQQGFYKSIAISFETHRIPDTTRMIHPFLPQPLFNPWIPFTEPIFNAISDSMYEKKKDYSKQPFIPFNREAETISSASPEDVAKIPDALNILDVNIQRDSLKPMSLREQLEKYGYPKKPTPISLPKMEKVSNPDAGWFPPASIALPSIWGCLFLLAELDDPQSEAGEFWEEYAVDIDSHPYTFLFYREFPIQGIKEERATQFVHYPDIRMSLLSHYVPRGRYLIASQAANETLVMPTYAIDHESFLISETPHEWRWFHDIPSSTHEIAADSDVVDITPQVAIPTIQTVTPLFSSLFSYWQTDTTSGRTFVVRRHIGGVGNGYTVVVHFPDTKPMGKRIEDVIFSVPEKGNVSITEENPDLYSIYPSEDELPDTNVSMEEWQMNRSAERRGERKNTVAGILNVLFSPDCCKPARMSVGALGQILEADLIHPDQPFFYLLDLDQPGREMFEVKYNNIPLPGMRILEWKQGIEIIAIKTGEKIQNSFMESDADIVIAMRDTSMKGLLYLMVNGTYLRCKFSPTQKDFILLADTKKQPVTVAWCQRHLYTTSPPRTESLFYAPEILGFECPEFVIQYGQRGNLAAVLGREPNRKPIP